MKPEKVPEIINMVDLVDEDAPKIEGTKPLALTKAQIRERFQMKPGEVKFYRSDQRPEFKKSVFRKRVCPLCGYSNGRLIAVCLKCKNCMACGSYTDDSSNEICRTCGNYNSTPPPKPPTINVGL